MRIGVPKEIKNHEYRVGLTPAGVHAFMEHGHQVMVQVAAGVGSGFEDEAYLRAGAQLIPTPEEIYAGADMIIKVKEP
ncbi:MAG: alanine dehydrogenase, partial [Actinobacteria bacterium]|nr:alanine dehydrogenase [Actinomycetota bacterium]